MKITLPKTLERFKLDYDTGFTAGYHEGYRQALIDQENGVFPKEEQIKEVDRALESLDINVKLSEPDETTNIIPIDWTTGHISNSIFISAGAGDGANVTSDKSLTKTTTDWDL